MEHNGKYSYPWHLSVWEICHRWENEDPDITRQIPPQSVRDRMRGLCHHIVEHQIRICNTHGHEFQNRNDWLGRESFLAEEDRNTEPSTQEDEEWRETVRDCNVYYKDRNSADEAYQDYIRGKEKEKDFHSELADPLRVILDRQYKQDIMEAVHITTSSLEDFCDQWSWDYPTFWVKESSHLNTEHPPARSATDEQSRKGYTPLMQLTLDAFEMFWGEDSNQPRQPKKSAITHWLLDQIKTRGIHGSVAVAEKIDTIIRPPETHKGGAQKQQKG